MAVPVIWLVEDQDQLKFWFNFVNTNLSQFSADLDLELVFRSSWSVLWIRPQKYTRVDISAGTSWPQLELNSGGRQSAINSIL